MGSEKVLAYWDFYDSATGELLEKERKIKHTTWPAVNELVTGLPGKPQAIVRNCKFRGRKEELPCYDVYV